MIKMPTTGSFGICFKGKCYLVYNHWDSYPSGLGMAIVDEIKKSVEDKSIFGWTSKVEELRIITTNREDDPTKFYCLLRFHLGSLKKMFSIGQFTNASPVGKYAYIVNLDTFILDCYEEGKKICSYRFDRLPEWDMYDEHLLQNQF